MKTPLRRCRTSSRPRSTPPAARSAEFNATGLQDFSRVANRKNPNGYYIEVSFESCPDATNDLKKRLLKIRDIFRVFFTKPA